MNSDSSNASREQLAADVAQLRAELAGEHRDRRALTQLVTQMLAIVRAVATARRLYSQRPGGGGEDVHLIPHSLVVRATELLTIPASDTHEKGEG